jgi:hypothetical protein
MTPQALHQSTQSRHFSNINSTIHTNKTKHEITNPILFSLFISSLEIQMQSGNWNLTPSGREYLRSGGLGGPVRVLVVDVRDSKIRG